MIVIDAHTHFMPPSLAEEASNRREWGIEITRRDGERWVTHEQGFAYPLHETFFGGEAKLRDMDSRCLDMSVMSISPMQRKKLWRGSHFAPNSSSVKTSAIICGARTQNGARWS